MSVKTVGYLNNLVSNAERGPSEELWGAPGNINAWIADFIQDPRLGYDFFDEFDQGAPAVALTTSANSGSYGKWAMYAYGNATIVDNSTPGASIQMVCGTTSHQGVALTSFAGCTQIINSSTQYQGRLAFEARVAVNSIVTTAASAFDAFVGLTDKGIPAAGVPITTTGNSLYNSCNLIGFQRIASVGNDWSFVYQLSGVAAVYPTNLQTLISTVTGSALTAATAGNSSSPGWHKLGFVYDPFAVPVLVRTTTTGNSTLGILVRPMIQIYVDGIAAGAFLTTQNIGGTAFPTGVMGAAIAVMNSSTATGLSLYVDWCRLAQNFIT